MSVCQHPRQVFLHIILLVIPLVNSSSISSHRKIGRVFYRTSSNPHVLLSLALDTSRKLARAKCLTPDHLNTKWHELACKLVDFQSSNPSSATDLDLSIYINWVTSAAPELWEHICLLTQSVNERRGRRAAVEETTLHGTIKRIRSAYLLSMMLFSVNSECTYPFHLLLADAVGSCGESTELLTMLNRLGAIVSLDNACTWSHNAEKRMGWKLC